MEQRILTGATAKYMIENDNTSRMMILLLEPGGNFDADLGAWLSANGFRAWKANDVSHALEELSDFTVRRRPDVVMLEVAGLSQRYEDLWSTFRSTGPGQVSMCAYTGRIPPRSRKRYFASNLDDLRSLICREVHPPVLSEA